MTCINQSHSKIKIKLEIFVRTIYACTVKTIIFGLCEKVMKMVTTQLAMVCRAHAICNIIFLLRSCLKLYCCTVHI